MYGASAAAPIEATDAEREEYESDMKLFRNIFMEANATVKAWGGKIYFVYIPRRSRYFPSEPRPLFREEDVVFGFVREAGVPIIDIRPRIDARGDPQSLFVFRSPSVYNEDGHRLIAESVIDSLGIN